VLQRTRASPSGARAERAVIEDALGEVFLRARAAGWQRVNIVGQPPACVSAPEISSGHVATGWKIPEGMYSRGP